MNCWTFACMTFDIPMNFKSKNNNLFKIIKIMKQKKKKQTTANNKPSAIRMFAHITITKKTTQKLPNREPIWLFYLSHKRQF